MHISRYSNKDVMLNSFQHLPRTLWLFPQYLAQQQALKMPNQVWHDIVYYFAPSRLALHQIPVKISLVVGVFSSVDEICSKQKGPMQEI